MTPQQRQKAIDGLSSDLETLEHLTACFQAGEVELAAGGCPEAGSFLRNARKALDDGRGYVTSAIRFIRNEEGATQFAGKHL